MGRCALLILICFAIVRPLRAAHADEGLDAEDEMMRRQLIDEGAVAAKRGDHATALTKLKKALSLKSSPSLLRTIAAEEKQIAAFAEALANAHLCVLEATRDKKLNNRKQILDQCQEIEDSVKHLVGHIVVNVRDAPAGLTVTAEGKEIKPPEFGDPYPVSPGRIVVEASAPGYKSFHAELQVGSGDNTPIAVSLSRDPDVAPVAPAAPGLRFDDIWSGVVECPRGSPHDETFRIVQQQRDLIATKVIGDDCVPAGVISWQGSLPRPNVTLADLPLTVAVRITVGSPNGRRSMVRGRLTIDGSDHMAFVGAPGSGFTRGEQAVAQSPPESPSPPPPPSGEVLARAEEPMGAAAPQFDVSGMPPVAVVWQRIVGRDPVDTAARQSAAFSQFIAIMRIAAGAEAPGRRMSPPAEQLALSYQYAGRQADQRGQSLIVRAAGARREGFSVISQRWFAARSVYDNERYRSELLMMCSPGVRAAYAARRR